LRRKAILSASLILEKNRWQKKQHARGKETCKRRSMQGEKEGKPNQDRVRVFDKYCNGYKPIK
jgi:hypothetical protein